jgi:hypothetical protein
MKITDRNYCLDQFRRLRATGFSELDARERVRQIYPAHWENSGLAGMTLQGIANEAQRLTAEEDKPYQANRNASRQSLVNAKIAEGKDYDTAWREAARENPGLFNTVSAGAPKGVKMSHDGQELITGAKPTPEQLLALGLAMNATDEEIRIFRTASQAELTPEIAALVVRTNVEEAQASGGGFFDAALKQIKDEEPKLFKLALNAQNAQGGMLSEDELIRMGLPPNAEAEAVSIWRAAAKVELTPEIAALVVRTSIQGIDGATGGGTFSSTMKYLKEHRPEIHSLAMKARPKQIVPGKKVNQTKE